MNKKYLFFILIIISIDSFASSSVPFTGTAWQLGPQIKTFIESISNLFDPVWNKILSASKNYLIPIFKALFLLDAAYTIAKAYLEGNYKGIATNFVIKSFFYSTLFSFLSNMYYFSIPAEIISKILGTEQINFNNENPLTALSKIYLEIFAPWDKAVALPISVAKDAYDTVNSLNLVGVIFCLFLLVSCIIVAIIGYLVLLLVSFGLLMKAIEFVIAVPLSVFFLAFKATKVLNSYAETSINYIITAIFDLSILLLVAKIGDKIINSSPVNGSFIDFAVKLFPLLIYATIIKIAPKIGSGIMSGKPQVGVNDVANFVSTAVLAATTGGAIAIGSVAGVSGAAGGIAGGVKGLANGEGMMKGAISGAKSGATKGMNLASKVSGGQINAKNVANQAQKNILNHLNGG